jgi:hypothetical protein
MKEMTMSEAKNQCFKEGELIAHFEAAGVKVVPAIRSIDKLMPRLTCEEIQKLKHWMIVEALVYHDLDPEERRELLSRFDTCPCCDQWLGHNRPPADDSGPPSPYRRQKSFDFDR